jgi:hypothetical protein
MSSFTKAGDMATGGVVPPDPTKEHPWLAMRLTAKAEENGIVRSVLEEGRRE